MSRELLAGAMFFLLASVAIAAQRGRIPGKININTAHPGSVVFINNVRHGITNDAGVLELTVKPGTYPVRVRTAGFADWKGTVVVAADASKTLSVKQVATSDRALLHFQRAEDLRDKLKHRDAITEYEQALKLRPVFPEASIAMVRSLIPLQRFQEAESRLNAVIKGNKGSMAEAYTVLANLRRQQGLTEEAVGNYRTALRLARGVSPEAHIGLAIALNETGDVQNSIKEYRIGIAQNMDTEPILYYQLGNILEGEKRNREAIEAYQSYVTLDPRGELVSAVESMIEMLKKEP